MREQARLRKQQLKGSNPAPTPPTIPTEVNNVESVEASPAEPRRPKTQQSKPVRGPQGGLPFTDELYEDLKFVVGKLTAKIKSDTSMTSEDLEKFRLSVNNILSDALDEDVEIPAIPVETASLTAENGDSTKAQQATEPKPPQPAAPKATEVDNEPDAGAGPVTTAEEAFSGLRGKTSTWEVDGMENMTTEEFYAALNKRNADVRKRLRDSGIVSGGAQQVDDYLAGLNSRAGENTSKKYFPPSAK